MKMNTNIISIRELQRNYRGLVNKVKETGQAVYLGARLQPEVVLLGVKTFEDLKQRVEVKSKYSPQNLKMRFEALRKSGRQGISLSKLIYEDRQSH
jgi:PHD/YefM family antitoxin component YafN of YafNO toxin-antitoxin module